MKKPLKRHHLHGGRLGKAFLPSASAFLSLPQYRITNHFSLAARIFQRKVAEVMIRYPRDRHLKLHLKLDLPLIDQVPHAIAASVSGLASPSMLPATDDDFQSPNFP